MQRLLPAIFIIAIQIVSAPAGLADPTVTISQGALRGATINGVEAFRGIPYAAPPTAEQRWRRAQPPGSWSGVRDARSFGNVCPQTLISGNNRESLESRTMSEDCLSINVHTATLTPAEPLPVMVWLLPGSFRRGDAGMSKYEPTALAAQGVVVVSFNYRLGYLGQFAHPALMANEPEEAIGNYYLSDQVAALEWVAANIAEFGGDPDNVTIFGMSAGGVSVNYLLGLPAAAGLFHKAISQSSSIRPFRTRRISEGDRTSPPLVATGTRLTEKHGIGGDNDAVVAALRNLSWQEILEYQSATAFGSLNPVIDGILVREGLGPVFSEGRQHKVPYLTGATSWEGSLLQSFDNADLLLSAFGISRDKARALYGDVDDREIIDGLEFDLFFGSQRWLAGHQSRAGLPTWLYRFDYVAESQRETVPGAAHGAETEYVFNSLGWRGYPISDKDREMSRLVSSMWVQFAKTGNPNVPGGPSWPSYAVKDDELLNFGPEEITIVRDHEKERMEFMDARYDSGAM